MKEEGRRRKQEGGRRAIYAENRCGDCYGGWEIVVVGDQKVAMQSPSMATVRLCPGKPNAHPTLLATWSTQRHHAPRPCHDIQRQHWTLVDTTVAQWASVCR